MAIEDSPAASQTTGGSVPGASSETAAVVPGATTAAAVVPPNPDYPAKLDVPYVESREAGSLWFRHLRVLGLWFYLAFQGWGAMFSVGLNNYYILFTGRYRQKTFDTVRRYLTAYYQYLAYRRMLVQDPPTVGQTDYPVAIELPHELPVVTSRLRFLYVGFLVIPQTLEAVLYMWAGVVVEWYGWWAALFGGGRFPAAAHRFNVIGLRKLLRLHAFLLLMTEEKPPTGGA